MTEKFERLIESFPRIAEVVNSFNSEEVQRLAFGSLVASLGETQDPTDVLVSPAPSDRPDRAAVTAEIGTTTATGANGKSTEIKKRRATSSKKKIYSATKGINFRPDGKTALLDFAESKNPTSNDEKNAVAVYWLIEELGKEEVSVSDVLAVYRDRLWKYPANPANALQITASKFTWLDTSNMEKIALTHSGQYFVEQDLPRQARPRKR